MDTGITMPFSPISDTLAIVKTGPPPERPSRDVSIVRTSQKSEAKIWLGKPTITPLTGSKEVATSIRDGALVHTVELFLVHFACSFRPVPGLAFMRVTVEMELWLAGQGERQPLVHDMFPRLVEMPTSYKRRLMISPNLELTLPVVGQASVSALEAETSHEFVKYDPEIVAYGVGESTCGWDIAGTKGRELRGIRELALIVEKPPSVPLVGRCTLDAELRTTHGMWKAPGFSLEDSGANLPVEVFVIQ